VVVVVVVLGRRLLLQIFIFVILVVTVWKSTFVLRRFDQFYRGMRDCLVERREETLPSVNFCKIPFRTIPRTFPSLIRSINSANVSMAAEVSSCVYSFLGGKSPDS
jgi:hypothetical protein